MSRQELIFSGKAYFRGARHLLFWLVYSVYFYLQSLNPSEAADMLNAETYRNAFISLACFLPACVFSVYIAVNLLFIVLRRKWYVVFLVSFILLFLVDLYINYWGSAAFYERVAYGFEQPVNASMLMALSNTNSMWAVIIAGLALGIKLGKDWYLQQEENLQILARKKRTELQMRKARINPEFLFRSLQAIYSRIKVQSEDPPTMVLKLADILSYTLYQNETEYVPLATEFRNVADLVYLEERNPANRFKISLKVKSSPVPRYILRMSVLLLLQDILSRLRDRACLEKIIIYLIPSRKGLDIQLLLKHPEGKGSKYRRIAREQAAGDGRTSRMRVTVGEKEDILLFRLPYFQLPVQGATSEMSYLEEKHEHA